MLRYYEGNEYAMLDRDAINLRTDYGFFEYKLDVFELALCMGIRLIPYSEVKSKLHNYLLTEVKLCDGFTVMYNTCNGYEYLICYNDKLPEVRQRFTIAHEIKHVLYREINPTQKEEDLADHFARVLLAPPCLVMLMTRNYNAIEIGECFGVSKRAADNAINAANGRMDAMGDRLKQYEADYMALVKSQRITA